METKIMINQNIAILIDGNNIEKSIHNRVNSNNAMLNFDTFIPKILANRSLRRLIYFREGKSISEKLSKRLQENFFGDTRPCHKSADIPLAIEAIRLAPKIDTIIILSGDSDYIDLIKELKSSGVRVEIAGIKESTHYMVVREANYYHEITNSDIYFFNKNIINNYEKAE